MNPDYQTLLNVAVDAAREAGALLREEFLQPGGPRGSGSYAEADAPAERQIRDRLLAATPAWAFRGEETGDVVPAGWPAHDTPAHIWLVDPNDGTAAYLEGARGSAVSIALLRDGIPVLGVIYAFAAPDNAGDLFAWAEGCGPMRRNGADLPPRARLGDLFADVTVLVTHRADHHPERSVALTAPAVYRAAPSIAYRMALVAAGAGEIAISTNGPQDWDYAAGHALLRGAGGAFVDQDGAPITYTRDGRSVTAACIGGAPQLVGVFAERLRRTRWTRSGGQSPRRQLCRPRPGATVADNALLRRAQGCLLGQLAGDALGGIVEFKSAREILRLYPSGLRELGPSSVWDTLGGQPTDDSELALMLARTLAAERRFDDEHVAEAYSYWYESAPFDIGTTTSVAMSGMQMGASRGRGRAAGGCAAANTKSEANGALMRQSPLAIWGHALPPQVLDRYVRADTTLTHPNRVCQDASAAFVVALAAIVRDGLDGKAAHALALRWDREHGTSPGVTRALEDARTSRPEYEHNIGHVLIALQNAFYQALHAPTLEEGVVDTAMAGGDTDTNAAIAGALLGAIHGAPAVPPQWRRTLLCCRPHPAHPDVHRPRPEAFWPVDVLMLAERLLIAGRQNQ